MTIDIPTLFTLVVMLCVVVGSMFLGATLRGRHENVGRRAGLGLFAIAVGIMLVLLRGTVPYWLSIVVANAILASGIGLLWSAVRLFEHRTAPVPVVLAGAAVWVAACAIPSFYATLAWRIALISFIAAAYALAAGFECWRGRNEPLQARMPLTVLCFAHALFVGLRGAFALAVPPTGDPLEGSGLQNLFMTEAPLALVAASLLWIAMVRERAERELRREAETDDLTGVLNRRAFFARARVIVAEARRSGLPAVLLLFDLDHFKSINDRFGHAVGDRALRLFAGIGAGAVRASDLFGRIGGEEFAALLPGCDADTARHIADRVRGDLSSKAIVHDGAHVPATVSVGIASTAEEESADIDLLMARADEALYRSKRAGRDRVSGSFAAVG